MISPSISVVLPAFNEAMNLPATVANLSSELRRLRLDYEIIVVNDGSADETAAVCRRLVATERSLRIVSHQRNRGYGAALRTGFENACHDFVYLTDADGQFDVEHLREFLDRAGTADAVIGYRATRSDVNHRIILSRVGNWIARQAFGLTVRDINCAAKLLRRSRLISLQLSSNGAMISTELLYRAQQGGWKIIELPVHHFSRTSGRATGGRATVVGRTILEFLRVILTAAQRVPRPAQSSNLTRRAAPSPD